MSPAVGKWEGGLGVVGGGVIRCCGGVVMISYDDWTIEKNMWAGNYRSL